MAIDRWTSGADYDRWMGRWSRLLAHEFLEWLNLPESLRWVDLCCGSGVLTRTIVENCSPARVVGIDASPQQIAFARRQATSTNVAFEIADAMSLPFADAMFDIAVCGLGLNYLPDPVRALQEFQRVVGPGGTIASYVWDFEDGARFLREFWDAAIAIDPDASNWDQARRFSMCTEWGLSQIFQKAGLKEPATATLNIVTHFDNFDDYWEPLLGGQGSAPNYLATLDSPTQTKIRDRLKAALPVARSGAIELPARAWAIRGRVV